MRSKIKGVVVTLLTLSTAGCATTGPTGQAWNPTIDQRNVDQARYETDLAECRSYAEANPDANAQLQTRDGAMRTGLVTGAIMLGTTVATGGLALLPMLGGGLLAGAGGGAVLGAASGQQSANLSYRSTVSTCLQGRGYSVIG